MEKEHLIIQVAQWIFWLKLHLPVQKLVLFLTTWDTFQQLFGWVASERGYFHALLWTVVWMRFMCCPLWVFFVVLQQLFSANQWQLSLKICGNMPVRKQKTTRYFWKSFIAYFEARFWDGESHGAVRTEKAGQRVLALSTPLLCLCVIPSVRARIAQLKKRDGALGGICYVTPTVLFSCQILVPESWVSETCSTETVHLSWVMLLKGQGMALTEGQWYRARTVRQVLLGRKEQPGAKEDPAFAIYFWDID